MLTSVEKEIKDLEGLKGKDFQWKFFSNHEGQRYV